MTGDDNNSDNKYDNANNGQKQYFRHGILGNLQLVKNLIFWHSFIHSCVHLLRICTRLLKES